MSDTEIPELPEKAGRRIALFITVLTLMLALAELGAKSAQTEMIAKTIEASDSWAFYQAKSIRQTVVRTIADALDALPTETNPGTEKQSALIAGWRKTADRYESDPSTGEGKKELSERATELQHERDHAGLKYHNFEIASVALQISVVLASTAVVTEISGFVILAAIGGTIGALVMLLATIMPELMHSVIAGLGL